nr:balbiani ring protein 3-like [Hydra vulgaris]XP_047143343.1 balbiani ring protein 3-like [Hydra vulgaris]
MKFTEVARITYIFAQLVNYLSVSLIYSSNVGCGPYPFTVITHKDYKFFPFAVMLTRCYGKDTHHSLMRCAPTLSKQINISTVSFDKIPYTTTVLNHISCEEKCTINALACNQYQFFSKSDCQCLCKHDTHPISCKHPFVWDKTLCNCACQYNKNNYKCEIKKRFSVADCGCVCKPIYYKRCMEQPGKLFNPLTCECEDLTLITNKLEKSICKNDFRKFIVVVFFVEAVGLFLILFFFTRYCNSRKLTKK